MEIKLKSGKRYKICSCGLSQTLPFCDNAHRDFNASANELKTALQEELNELSIINPDDFLDNRIEKYDKLGYFQESI